MKKLLSCLACLVIASGVIASGLVVVACNKTDNQPQKHQLVEIEKDLQKVIDGNKQLWTAQALQAKIDQVLPKVIGLEVRQGEIDPQIGVETFDLDADHSQQFTGQLQLSQVLNEENQNQTIYLDHLTHKITIAKQWSAPEGTREILNIGWYDYGLAHALPSTVEKVPNYISPKISNLDDFFANIQNFNCYEVSLWDTSHITQMARTFFLAKAFNQDLSQWNVTNVTDMQSMFYGAQNFNGDVTTWNTAHVINMDSMFREASVFNQNLHQWNTSNVEEMPEMFASAKAFNGDLSTWNTTKVREMPEMFASAKAFSGDLSKWNTSQVLDMSEMFVQTDHFNCNLGQWDTSKVTNMESMFDRAKIFIQDLSKWNVALVTNHKNFANNPNWPKEQQPHFKNH
ncbi:BspA family leucine-rich repeat surface protein [Williamsoniiplasma lucivorax]|uniref:Lipoprotein n=1 Tax=Williamsoniiplasma lucivorax TaxID=209274 RepID=A0A2S5RG99_9MOLU|nr:BspA family leucine-rich repeat surface protein [Williamsoniiplasma lucivorax]PPE06155.1 hypothetical protein ELUCI_v1c04460 [Williamsoniiplasma lucivorax]